ncbi:MAG: hypothetical protein QNK19_09650 [Xanthomonadales bacterium]|nr:hypothetical protein [Xanthomonadales bacterium]
MKKQSAITIAFALSLGLLSQEVLAWEEGDSETTSYGRQYSFGAGWSSYNFIWENEWGDTFERDLAYMDYEEEQHNNQCDELYNDKPDACYDIPGPVTELASGYRPINYLLAVGANLGVLESSLASAIEKYAYSSSSSEAATEYWEKGQVACESAHINVDSLVQCYQDAYNGARGLKSTWSLSMPFSFSIGPVSLDSSTVSAYGPALLTLVDQTVACTAWHDLRERLDC